MDGGALLGWAIWAVESLEYLDVLDDDAFGANRDLRGCHPDVVDIAHCRWASSTAITSLDLCAAALQAFYCPGRRAWSMRSVTAGNRGAEGQRNNLPQAAIRWIDTTVVDANYKVLLEARNPFTHHRHKRTLQAATVPPGPHEQRTRFPVGAGGALVDARDLVLKAHDFAVNRTESLFALIKDGTL